MLGEGPLCLLTTLKGKAFKFHLVKATVATCVIVTAPYLHSVLGSLGSLPLLHVHRTHNTAPKLSFSTLLITAGAKHDIYTQILIFDQLVLDFGFTRFRINAIRINEGPLYSFSKVESVGGRQTNNLFVVA